MRSKVQGTRARGTKGTRRIFGARARLSVPVTGSLLPGGEAVR